MLNKNISGKELLQMIGLAAFIVVVVSFHRDAQEIKAEIKEEKACMSAAVEAAELQKCFDLMKLNNARR